tara:strand:+ start:104 stop:1195 length:1092 start_codon:yes stop_codon:yes gene_type:complete
MNYSNIFIYNKTWLESGMANIVQTLHMAQRFDSIAKTTICIRCGNENYQDQIKNIISSEPTFRCIVKNKNALMHFISSLISLNAFERKNTIFYSRTVLMCIVASIMGFNSVLELHQDKLGRFEFISKLFVKLLNMNYFLLKLKIVVISQSLKEIIIFKYNVKSKIYVSHDAADMPSKLLLNLTKRRRGLVVYTGKLGNDRSVGHIVELAKSDPGSDFRIIGGTIDQVRELRQDIKQLSITNLKIFSRQRYSRIRFFQCKASILIAFWSKDVPTMKYCSPLKLFEYMQTGNKILLHNFRVFEEVVPKNILIRKCEPDNKASELAEYKYLRDLNFSDKDRAKLSMYGANFTYKARVSNIFEFISR